MILKLRRTYKKDKYTIGDLFVDGQWFCNTLEDKDRGLSQSLSVNENNKLKVYGETAIPKGKYKVTFTDSPKFGSKSYAIKGKVPLVNDVKCFMGIRLHAGTYAKDTLGCILLGENRIQGGIVKSVETCTKLFKKMWEIKDKETIWLIIE